MYICLRFYCSNVAFCDGTGLSANYWAFFDITKSELSVKIINNILGIYKIWLHIFSPRNICKVYTNTTCTFWVWVIGMKTCL